MKKPERMAEELKEIGWSNLGYDGVLFQYIKDVSEIASGIKGRGTRAYIKVDIDIYAGCCRFTPKYKLKYDMADIIAMFYAANQFMEIASKYGYKWKEVLESETLR